MKAISNKARIKILTAAVICTCTMWNTATFAASGGSIGGPELTNAYCGEKNTTANGVVAGKTITIEADDTFNGVYGGYSFKMSDSGWTKLPSLDFSNQANGNTVTINGGTITGNIVIGDNRNNYPGVVAGGWSNYTSNNTVTINNGKIETHVYGGYSMVGNNKDKDHPEITNNHVTISGGEVSGGNIAGAYVDSDGKNNNNNTISNNTVTIANATIISTGKKNGNIYGACSYDKNSSLEGNKVIIESGKITSSTADSGGGIYGAFADRAGSTGKNNTVTIKGGEINANIYGAYVWADNDNAVIEGNGVVITGGTIKGNVFAADSRTSYGTFQDDGISVSGETADLSNATLAGYRFFEKLKTTSNIYLNITNFTGNNGKIQAIKNFNNVVIENSMFDAGSIDYVTNINIENGNNYTVSLGKVNSKSNDSTDGFQYQTIINTDSKIQAQSLENLNQINVDMTNIAWEKDGTVINVSDEANLANTDVSVNGKLSAAAGADIKNGDSMSFIKAGTLSGITAQDIDDKKVLIGFAQEAKVTLEDKENSIDFVVSGMPQANGQTSIIANSRTAAIAFANQGSDVLAEALNNVEDGKYGIKTFAVVHGNRSKYDVGNDVKINGWSVLAGVGESKQIGDNEFSWGVFYENGSGNYRTYNDFNGNNLTGYGSSVYNGGGAMTKYASESGAYVEAGIRTGTLKNSLSNAVADGFGAIGGYDVDSSYYGFLAGVGKVIELNEKENIDVYGKYFYTHHEGKDFSILGDKVEFDSAESNRLKLGVRYNKNTNETFSHYYGVAWDYEFSGDSDTYAAGLAADGDSLQGSTAVMELGMKYAPEDSKWYFDLGVQGYAGKRQGFSGNVQATYNF